MHAIIRNDAPELLGYGPFTGNDGTSHPASVLQLWSDAELAAIDVFPVVADEVPAGQVATGFSLVRDGTIVRQVWTLEPAPAPDLFAYAKDARWQREQRGVTVEGLTVPTDDRTKLLATGAKGLAEEFPEKTFVWDLGTYELTLTGAQVKAIAIAVGLHADRGFTIYGDVAAAIRAGTITTTAEVDAAFSGA
ncbi:DUF4376 domain-containing protein [Microvirga yunnanensis]|uniref:DUF4376 domain-containing protein n=1 Tax=Microvirga yunnanensis TaxID=2953740 RepID=UPI0021CAB685|nr:DUF4376 domain-containing protein [Microvirga sp. HBU67655]